MKYFIVADVHGYYDVLQQTLNDAGFNKNNPEHIFVSLGDIIDRGNKPLECLQFVNSLERKILIRGNHEDLMEEAIVRKYFLSHDLHNGTKQTAYDIIGKELNQYDILINMKTQKDYNNYIRSTVDYYDDGQNIFVHGWIPKDDDWQNGNWRYARWENGMFQWLKGVRLNGKTIYCGHWHTSWGHCHINKTSTEWGEFKKDEQGHLSLIKTDADFSPFIDNGIVALDACTAYSNKINCFVVEKPLLN